VQHAIEVGRRGEVRRWRRWRLDILLLYGRGNAWGHIRHDEASFGWGLHQTRWDLGPIPIASR
jgi:hypothetical protein